MGQPQLLWDEAPPARARMSLRGGERVTLYEDLGDRLEPIRAVVLGVTKRGTYVGEFEDGTRSEFDPSSIASVEVPRNSMGGIFDAFKSKKGFEAFEDPKKTKGELIPAPPEKEKGLMAPIKGFLKSLAPGTGEIAQKSIFEVFQPPPIAPSIPMPFVERAASIIPPADAPSILAPFIERAESIILPADAPGMLAPYIERAAQPFKHIEPSPPSEPWEVTQAKQQELWAGMFEPEQEVRQEMVPAEERQVAVRPSRPEKYRYEQRMLPERVEIQPFSNNEAFGEEAYPPPATIDPIWYDQTDFKVLPLPQRPPSQVFPDAIDVARGLVTFWQRRDTSVDALMDDIRSVVDTLEWQQNLQDAGCAEYPFESLTTGDAHPYIDEAIAMFLQIPPEAIEEIGGGNREGEYLDPEAIADEIWYPGLELIGEAMNLLKPADLAGRFIISDANHNGSHVLTYVEGVGPCARYGCPKPDMGDGWDCFEGVKGKEGRVRGAFGEYAEESEEEPEEEAPRVVKPAKKKKAAPKKKKKTKKK